MDTGGQYDYCLIGISLTGMDGMYCVVQKGIKTTPFNVGSWFWNNEYNPFLCVMQRTVFCNTSSCNLDLHFNCMLWYLVCVIVLSKPGGNHFYRLHLDLFKCCIFFLSYLGFGSSLCTNSFYIVIKKLVNLQKVLAFFFSCSGFWVEYVFIVFAQMFYLCKLSY